MTIEAPKPSDVAPLPQSLTITLNAQALTTRAETLEGLVIEQGHAGSRIATAVNGTFVPAKARSEMKLRDGDRVEIVTPRQGG
ncbi:MAG: sulfur carrier protein ThiS [Hyphomicrobium sp.]